MTAEIQLTPAQTDKVMVQELEKMKTYFLGHQSGTHHIFSNDDEDDAKKVRKMIGSINRLLEWYSVRV